MSRIHDALRNAERALEGRRNDDPGFAPLSPGEGNRVYLEPPAMPSEEAGVLQQSLAALRSHWMGLVLITALCTAGALVKTLSKPPVYRARALVEVMGLNENFLNLHSMDPTTVNSDGTGSLETYLHTQIDILQSETLAARVVDKLGLDRKPEYQEPARGKMAELYRVLGMAPVAEETPKERAIKAALENLRVQTSRQASILTVEFGSPDRQLAARFVNALTDLYNEESLQSRWRAAQHTGEWLQSRLSDVKRKLEASEEALQASNRSLGLMATDSNKGSVAEEKLRQVQEELSKVEADRIEKQSQYEMAKTQNPQGLPAVLDDGPLREYQVKLADLRRQEAEQSVLLAPTSYKVLRLQAQIHELESALTGERANIVSRIRNSFEAAKVRETLLRAQYESQTAKVEDLSRKMASYNTLKHAVDSNRLVYESMLQKVNDAGVATAVRASNIRVLDAAKAPTVPAEPNVPFNLAIGFTSGLLLGVSWVAIRESTNSCLRKPGKVSCLLRVPELGVVPSIKLLAGRRTSAADGEAKPAMPSLLADSFRAIVTSILCSGRTARVLTVTSPSPGDGKTTISANLASSLAGIGQSVLLIEGDPRSQRLQRALGVEGREGLSDLLAQATPVEQIAPEAYIQRTRLPGVFLLSNGTKREEIGFLLYSRRIELLLQQLRRRYDTIIFDTPPLLLAPEARICGRLSDGVVLVVRAGRTTREMAIACQKRLAEDGTTLLGTILNDSDIDPTTHDYYSSTKRNRAESGELTIASA